MKEIIFNGLTFNLRLKADRVAIAEDAHGLMVQFQKDNGDGADVEIVSQFEVPMLSPDYQRFKDAVQVFASLT